LTISDDLAYIIGVLLGDGSVSSCKDGHYTIQLSVTSKKFALEFFSSLKRIGLNPHIAVFPPPKPSRLRNGKVIIPKKKQYRVRAYSKKFVLWFKKLTFEEIERMLNCKMLQAAFVRGIYESEGNIRKDSRGNRRIVIANTNLELLKLVQKILYKWGVYATISDSPKYQLRFFRSKDIQNFLKITRPCIKRG